MCWVKRLKKSEERIRGTYAKEDIVVYKVGYRARETEFYSIVKIYEYEVNKIPKRIKIKPVYKYDIYSRYVEINEGYHSYPTLKRIYDNYSRSYLPTLKGKIGVFVIPKGTRYFYSSDNVEYVSEKLIYKGKLKEN